MAPKKGLGKGLDILIPVNDIVDKNDKNELQPEMYVKITKVEPNPNQPRKQFNEDKLQELADSIKEKGIISPIIVQDMKTYYEIIAGERRWRAAKIAGLKEVPVIVRNYTEQEKAEVALIENIQREDLNPIEEAVAYKELMDSQNITQDEVAEKVSKSRTTITNAMRLLKLDSRVQDMISQGHARALLGIEDLEEQYQLAQEVFDNKLSVREIEKRVRDINKPKKEKKKKEIELDFLYRDLEEKMKINLGTKVAINAKNDEKGKIEIEYYSKNDLERLTNLFINGSINE